MMRHIVQDVHMMLARIARLRARRNPTLAELMKITDAEASNVVDLFERTR